MRRAVALVLLAGGCATARLPAATTRRAEAVVWGALGGPSPAARLRATELALALADPLLLRGLPARLDDDDARVRATAAAALAARDPHAADRLREALAGVDATARVAAIAGVDALPDGAARLRTLAGDRDVQVRARAASAIAAHRLPDATALLTTLAHDPDGGVRGQALLALATRGDGRALAEAALGDRELGVRLAALTALARLAGDGAAPRLSALAAGDDRFVGLRAALMLAQHGRREPARAAVRAALAASDPALRVAALNVAGELGDDGATLAAPALGDPRLDVQLATARALVATGHAAAARPLLLAALAGPRALDAADELARLGDARGLERLRAAAGDADAAVRRDALARLAPLPAARATLEAALADPDVDARLAAAAALLRRR